MLSRIVLRFFEIASIAICLVAAIYAMGRLNVLPEHVKFLGNELSFKQQIREAGTATDNRMEELEGNVATLTADFIARFDRIERQLGTVPPASLSEARARETQSADLKRIIQTASTDRAVGASVELSPSDKTSVTGWVWLGTYTREGRWDDLSVVRADGSGLRAAPDSLLPGLELNTVTNLNVRASQPLNDQTYFKSIERLGFIDKGDSLRLVSAPRTYDRAGAYQVWAQVETQVRKID